MWWLRSCIQRFVHAWFSVQVEFHGYYSAEKVGLLGNYMKWSSYWRMIVVCLVTPLPSLLLSVLNDLAPLSAPEKGVYANWVFWIRMWTTACFVNGSVVLQIGHYAPRLLMKKGQVAIIAVLTASTTIALTFGIATATMFPLPFTPLVAAPPTAAVIFSCFAFYWGTHLKADAALKHEVAQQIAVFMGELSLTFVYPLYIYCFTSLSGENQAWFTFVLLIIKLISKNLMSRVLENQHDIKPVLVVFNVEVFNALYVSCALQSALSLNSTAIVMLVDVVQFWLSMNDLIPIMNEIKALMKRIPRTHPAADRDFIQIAQLLLAHDSKIANTARTQVDKEGVTIRSESREMVEESLAEAEILPAETTVSPVSSKERNPRKCLRSQKLQMLPVRIKPLNGAKIHVCAQVVTGEQDCTTTASNGNSNLSLIFSQKDRSQFLRRATQVLFITEYLILVEYTEVILPIVYSIHNIVVYKLPNSVYYPNLASTSSEDFTTAISNVLVYAGLELVSMIVCVIALNRTLGVSPLRQLVFVLDMQAGMVQSHMMLWFAYILQVPLVHFGADFTFSFQWL